MYLARKIPQFLAAMTKLWRLTGEELWKRSDFELVWKFILFASGFFFTSLFQEDYTIELEIMRD